MSLDTLITYADLRLLHPALKFREALRRFAFDTLGVTSIATLSKEDPEQFNALYQSFLATQIEPETIEEKVVEQIQPTEPVIIVDAVETENIKLHDIEFDGTNMVSSLRLNNPKNKDAYKEWCETQKVTEWLAALSSKLVSDGMQAIPYTTRQLSIKVHWGDKISYEAATNQTPTTNGIVNLTRKVTEKVGSNKALHVSRKSSSALIGNNTEGYTVTDSSFWHTAWVVQEGITERDGVQYKTLEHVPNNEETPNFAFKWCSITDLHTKQSYFGYTRKKTQAQAKPRVIKLAAGVESLHINAFIGELHHGGYSEPFQCVIRTNTTNAQGQEVMRRETCRLRVAAPCLNEGQAWRQNNTTVDKTTRIWLDVKNGINYTQLCQFGVVSFASMTQVWVVQDFDSSVSRYKTLLRQYGRHIIKLLKQGDPVLLAKECKKFTHFPLRYENNILYAVRQGQEPLPLMQRMLDSHVPLVELALTNDAANLLYEAMPMRDKAQQWLQKNHIKWLDIPEPTIPKLKQHDSKFMLKSDVRFCGKQTVRWGNPSLQGYPVTEAWMIDQAVGMMGAIDDLNTFVNCKYDLCTTIVQQQFAGDWDRLETKTQKALVESRLSQMQFDKISQLFSPRGLGLTAEDGTPSKIWFDIVSRFWDKISHGKIKLQYNL